MQGRICLMFGHRSDTDLHNASFFRPRRTFSHRATTDTVILVIKKEAIKVNATQSPLSQNTHKSPIYKKNGKLSRRSKQFAQSDALRKHIDTLGLI
jgi:hypothetical protein